MIVVECKCLNGGGDQTDITKLENLTEKFGGTFAKGVYAAPNSISVSARSKIINSRAVVGVCGKKAIKKLIAKPFEQNPRTIYESVQ